MQKNMIDMLTVDLTNSRRQLINMTPRAGKNLGASAKSSSGKKFLFPPEEEKKGAKIEKKIEKDDGMLTKEELYEMLQAKNEELEECKE